LEEYSGTVKFSKYVLALSMGSACGMWDHMVEHQMGLCMKRHWKWKSSSWYLCQYN